MTSQRPLAGALDKVFPHLLILLYGLGAAVIYDHHWPFRGHGDNPILDLVDFHHPAPWIHSLFLSEPAGLPPCGVGRWGLIENRRAELL